MISGLLKALFEMIANSIRLNRCLKTCLVEQTYPNIETFEYKGKIYNRRLFVELVSDIYGRMREKDIERAINEAEIKLAKSKYQEYDAAIIDAYKLALSCM